MGKRKKRHTQAASSRSGSKLCGKEGAERQGLCRRRREDGSRKELVCKGQGNLHRSLTMACLSLRTRATFHANAVVTRHRFAVLHCTEHAHCTWACGCFQFLHQHER